MIDDEDNTPVSKVDFLHGVKVVDIGDMRVSRGMTRRSRATCRHLHLTYCDTERRIFCDDCQQTITGYDAFISMVEFFDRQIQHLKAIDKKIKEAQEHNLRRLVTKALDDEWQKHASIPCCPHCSAGLLPDDFLTKRIRTTSKEMEMARRKRKDNK
jgi:hypothetical protein